MGNIILYALVCLMTFDIGMFNSTERSYVLKGTKQVFFFFFFF